MANWPRTVASQNSALMDFYPSQINGMRSWKNAQYNSAVRPKNTQELILTRQEMSFFVFYPGPILPSEMSSKPGEHTCLAAPSELKTAEKAASALLLRDLEPFTAEKAEPAVAPRHSR